MDFDEVVVKESPGLCRCCLSEGCYKELGTEYSWMSETEIYADMLLECFDVSISQQMEGPNGPNRLICEVCITRLRDACNFKKQVLESEKKFIDMVAKGEFRTKVMLYEQDNMKEEPQIVQADALEVEYLDELDFGDDAEDLLKDDDTDHTQTEDITVAPLPVKRGRGRPRKNPISVKPEKKSKIAKLEEKPRSSKSSNKGLKLKEEFPQSYTDKLASLRQNIVYLLHYGNVTPFHWNTRGFKCFYCGKDMQDCEVLLHHTRTKHCHIDLEVFIPQRIISKDLPVKVDIREIACKICLDPLENLEDLVRHIIEVHKEEYDVDASFCAFPFVLNRDVHPCALCQEEFDNFQVLITHMYRKHTTHSYVCQICGLSFVDQIRMKRHLKYSHIGFRCKWCKKIFDGFHKLEKHKEVSHGEVKLRNCSLCSESLQNNYQLKVHMGKVHNVEKYKVKCELCPKVCSTKGAMVLHVQSVHSEARYECDMCDYKTGIKWMVKLHKRKHFGEKNYECSLCKRKFGRSSNLRAHMKVHTGVFGRVCRWCRQGFVDNATLLEHVKHLHTYE